METGERYPLFIPSGSATRLKLVRGCNVAVGGGSNFTIDFDLRKSVIAPPGRMPNYLLKPALRLIGNLQVGTISGSVANALVTNSCTPFVYACASTGVAPDDQAATAAPEIDPVISAPVELDDASGEYRYKIAFLDAAGYTVSFTCDGSKDTPEGDEVLTFTGTANAMVTASQTTTVSFTQ